MFYRRLLDKASIKGKGKVQQKVSEAQPTSVSIQLDGWSQHHHGYIGLMANYINKDWRRAKLCLACAPFDMSHTGDKVARWVEMECDKWGITEDVGVVTTDTAANMLKIMDYLPIHFLHCGCLNHILQLVIKDEPFENPNKDICTYGNQSVQLSHQANGGRKGENSMLASSSRCANKMEFFFPYVAKIAPSLACDM